MLVAFFSAPTCVFRPRCLLSAIYYLMSGISHFIADLQPEEAAGVSKVIRHLTADLQPEEAAVVTKVISHCVA